MMWEKDIFSDSPGDHGGAGWLALAALGAGGLFIILAMMMFSGPSFSEQCAAFGGRVDSNTTTTTGINPQNGQPVIGTTTTRFCLSEDGRILDIG